MLVLKQRNASDLDEENALARSLLVPGATLYGYCNGFFGRDSYGDKTIVEVVGNVLCVREENGALNSAVIPNDSWVELVESSNRWLEDGENNGDGF